MKNLVIDTSVVKKKLRRIVSCLRCNSTADFSWLLMGPDLSSVKLLWGGLSLFCLVGFKSSELLSYLSFLFQNMKAISIIGHVLNGWMSLLMLFNRTSLSVQKKRRPSRAAALLFVQAVIFGFQNQNQAIVLMGQPQLPEFLEQRTPERNCANLVVVATRGLGP